MKNQGPGDWRIVGKIKDAHGLKGDVHFLLFSKSADWLEILSGEGARLDGEDESASELRVQLLTPPHNGKLTDAENTVVLKQTESRTARRIMKSKPFKNGLIVTLEGVEDRTAAEKLKGELVAIPADLLVGEDEYFLSEVEGFQVVDQRLGSLGRVIGFGSNTVQDLLIVEHSSSGQNIEIPFVDDWVLEIKNEAEGLIVMELPEGLVEVQIDPNSEPDDADSN